MNRLNITSKIYVWSVLMEPLLFFVILNQDVAGIGGNISRLLQLIVVLSLFLRIFFMSWKNIKIPNPLYDHYKWYFFYLVFILFSFFYGFITGVYDYGNSIVNIAPQEYKTGFSQLINSQYFRPFFEYVIAIYYFVYFVVFPKYLLGSKQSIEYFFKVFVFTFLLSLFIGVIDFLLVFLIDYEWIPRHLSDFRHVGTRFHGLAGEPRDAFVYLGFGIAMFYLKSIWQERNNINNYSIAALFLCMLLTQSSSGFIGLIIAAGLIFFYQLPRLPIKYLFSLFAVIGVISVFTYLSVTNSYRVMQYINAIPEAIQALESSADLPLLVKAQIVNIYPVWVRISEIIQLNFLPLLVGTGIGSTSAINSVFFDAPGVHNPHANLIRVAFEAGMIGLFIYIKAFISPIQRLAINRDTRVLLTIYMLFILGLNFGHRSSTLFIFLGTLLLIFDFIKNNNAIDNDEVS